MRLIDADALAEGLKLHYKHTDQKYDSDRQWAIGYNAGLDRALYSIEHARSVNKASTQPLTMEELRAMTGEPVWCAEKNCWGIIELETIGAWAGTLFLVWRTQREEFRLNIVKHRYTLYRCKPEDVR